MTVQFKIYAFVNSLTSLVTLTYFLNILTLLLLNQVFYMTFKQKMFDLSDYDYQDRFINVVLCALPKTEKQALIPVFYLIQHNKYLFNIDAETQND